MFINNCSKGQLLLPTDLFLTPKLFELDITPFIHDLILLNECVILRDFGGFDTSYKNAVFDKNKKTIVPPTKKVSFRPEWIKDNGVLEKYIAESLKIELEKASGYIIAYVADIKMQLEQKGFLLLDGIGKFQVNSDKKIVFTSIEEENYLADSFGLDMLEVEMEHEQKIEPQPKEFNTFVYKKRKYTGWYIAIGILLVFILITSYLLISGKNGMSLLGIFSNNVKKPDESELVIFGTQSKTLEDSVTKTIEQTLDKKTSPKNALSLTEQGKKEKEVPAKNIPETIEFTKSGTTYYLVAGSFKSASNADALKEKLQKKGFNPEIINAKGKFSMVVVGTYKDKDQANDELMRIRRKLGQSVWLMEK
jgi:nucleoid DNA-binding protein